MDQDRTQSPYLGFIDCAKYVAGQGWVLFGWAKHATDPNQSAIVQIYDRTQLIGSARAGEYRADLFNAQIGHGNYGFEFTLPPALMDGADHLLIAASQDQLLGGGPLIFNSGAVPVDPNDPEAVRFDPTWYLVAYGSQSSVQAYRGDYFAHFRAEGRAKGYLPHIPFDEEWYRAAYPDAAAEIATGQFRDAYDHYLRKGVGLRFNPCDEFDEEFYRALYPDVAEEIAAGKFVSGYQHFMFNGRLEGRDTCRYLRHDSYLAAFPQFARALKDGTCLSIIDHYVRNGRKRPSGSFYRNFHRLAEMAPAEEVDEEQFAAEIYGFTPPATEPDDPDALTPALHWHRHGLEEDRLGIRPRHPDYREGLYLRANPDIAIMVAEGKFASGYDHFLRHGWSEGRKGALVTRLPEAAPLDYPSLQRRLDGLAQRPVISVIMPTYRTDPEMLEACIDSVLRQIYPHWQFCIADDGSSDPLLRETLLAYQANDPRIKIHLLGQNGGISVASNAALALAEGDYVALLDHDDVITPDALLEFAAAIAENPSLDVLYSDEDKISADGKLHFEPAYKPGWSRDLLKSTMYIGHMTVYRTQLVREVGGFRPAFDGTQDYDLALRITDRTDRVHHIAKILYHWRMAPHSTATSFGNKPDLLQRQRLAIAASLARQGAKGQVVSSLSPGNWRVDYDLPQPPPMISVIIPTAGKHAEIEGSRLSLIRNCVTSLIDANDYPRLEILVLHNKSLAPSDLLFLQAQPNLRLIASNQAEFNFAETINRGVAEARGDYILLLNDDTETITPHFLQKMVGLAAQEGVGVVGAKLLFEDNSLQHVGIATNGGAPNHLMIGEQRLSSGPLNMLRLIHNVSAVTAACMVMKRQIFLEAGGFDVGLPLNYNDVDFCQRLRAAGLRVVLAPDCELYHFESQTKSGTYNWEAQIYASRWGVGRDDYVNPVFASSNPFYAPQVIATAGESGDFADRFPAHLFARKSQPRQNRVSFSFLLSVYNNPPSFLQELAQTILNQSYRHFEWIICDDGSRDPDTIAWLDRIASHPQVTLIRHPENRGIMAGYRSAFAAAKHDYVLPVDADDFITLDALMIFENEIEDHGRPEFLYSDECKSNEQSSWIHPFHKPDWDPLLFTNLCYVCHMCAIRRDVAKAVGCYQDDLATWSHDWDSTWRVVRGGVTPRHVRQILYAWRINPGSTASAETSGKPDTIKSQYHVLDRHLRLVGLDRKVSVIQNMLFSHDGIWRLAPKTDDLPPVTLVIDARTLKLDDLFENLLTFAYQGKVTVQILTGADRLDAAIIADLEQGARKQVGQLSVSAIPTTSLISALQKAAQDGLVGFIGEGVRLNPDWLTETAGLLNAYPEAALGGGRIVGPDGKIRWAGGFFGVAGFLDSPDAGRALEDGGYHGFAFCQKFVDGVSALNWVARGNFLLEALASVAPNAGPDMIATTLALAAYKEGKKVIFTPFNLGFAQKYAVICPAAPPGGSGPIPQSAYYTDALSSRILERYLPSYCHLEP